MKETLARTPMRVLGYLASCPIIGTWCFGRKKGMAELAAFMQRLTVTHVRRWHLHRKTVGCGHLYQGTYKSFPVESDEHLLTVLGYVERNAASRAGLVVSCAEDWRWSSLWRWRHPEVTDDVPSLTTWPLERPRQWLMQVNRAQPAGELEALHTSVQRGRPVRPAKGLAKRQLPRNSGSNPPFSLAADRGNANNWTYPLSPPSDSIKLNQSDCGVRASERSLSLGEDRHLFEKDRL